MRNWLLVVVSVDDLDLRIYYFIMFGFRAVSEPWSLWMLILHVGVWQVDFCKETNAQDAFRGEAGTEPQAFNQSLLEESAPGENSEPTSGGPSSGQLIFVCEFLINY